MRTHLLTAALAGLLACAADPPGKPQPGKAKSVAEQLAAIRKEQKDKKEALTKQLEKLQAELEKLDEQTADRLLELARKHPKDPGVLPALEQLVMESTPHAAAALALIQEHHLQSPRLGKLCLFLCEGDEADTARTEKFLRAVVARNTTAEVLALGSLALARVLYARAEAEGARPADREAALRDAEALLSTVVKKYAKVKLPDQETERTAGEEARPILFEIRHLGIGKTVPDLVGDDLDGKALKLSDYRGKVVLLDFWALSSGASAALVAHERRLVQRMKDRPFAIVGVNGDDPKELPDLLKKNPIPWRSLRNQRKDGATISREWNLKGWPTLFLIDAKGVIRHRWIGSPGDKVLDKAVEALVGEAESGKE
jgi:peroxiredoxin